jgi:hypothetical protein
MANFLSRLFSKSPNFERPDWRGGFVINIDGQKKLLDEDYKEWYKTNPFVFTAINERAKAVASCKFYVKTPEGEYIENDLTRKLNNPNQYLSKNEFIMQLMTYKGIWGTGYLYLNRFRPSETFDKIDFVNLPTDSIIFGEEAYQNFNYDYLYDILNRKNPDDKIKIFYQGIDGLFKKELDKNLLLPFFDSTIFTNPYYSESKLKSLRYVVSNIQAALESQNTFLSSPGGIGMLVPDNKDATGVSVALTDEEKAEIEKQLQNEYGSLSSQRNIRITNAPIKYIPTIVDVSKLKLNETIVQNALILFGAYGLPKELLTAMMTGSTFENQNTAYKNYLQGTAKNEMDSIANSLDTIFPSTEGQLVADISHLPIMQEDEKEKATVSKTNNEALRIAKDVWDDWLSRGIVNEQQYKEYFKL